MAKSWSCSILTEKLHDKAVILNCSDKAVILNCSDKAVILNCNDKAVILNCSDKAVTLNCSDKANHVLQSIVTQQLHKTNFKLILINCKKTNVGLQSNIDKNNKNI